uniref:Uncharacterized protein n=1 Tax=Kitasatospora sp. CMC57 TaxID=3231513 RepID=A0AB33JSU7_9ACTN
MRRARVVLGPLRLPSQLWPGGQELGAMRATVDGVSHEMGSGRVVVRPVGRIGAVRAASSEWGFDSWFPFG